MTRLTVVLRQVVITILLMVCYRPVFSNTAPADLLNLSLEELMMVELPVEESPIQPSNWRFTYHYQKVQFETYRDGQDDLQLDEVLFVPGENPRSDSNFPVLPTIIDQEVHALTAVYTMTPTKSIQLTLPYLRQSTDHISIVPGYDEFVITTSGIGDVTFSMTQQWSTSWLLTAGLSFPTGSIDKKGDTPRAPGDQVLPYSMQLGSGTYDLPVSLRYSKIYDRWKYAVTLSARWRIGENKHDYALGDRYGMAALFQWHHTNMLSPYTRVTYNRINDISGGDDRLLVPGPYPYPAPVTNPALYGGKQIDVTFGLRYKPAGQRFHIDLEVSKPVALDLNGPQVQEDLHYGLSIGFR